MHVLRFLLCILCFSAVLAPTAQAAPQDYIDYVPKYRSEQTNVMLSKISYTDYKMMVYFQYVVEEKDQVLEVSGMGTETPWKLHTSERSRSGMLIKLGAITDVKVNGTMETPSVDRSSVVTLSPAKGDIITGVVHFDRLPGGVRSIHFTAGTLFQCRDLMIKDATHPLLGTQAQMEGSVDHFRRSMTAQGIQLANNDTPKRPTADIRPTAEEDPALARAEAPIDYAPKQLRTSADISCNTRVNLKNVYFDDNSASYDGRVEALKTIQVIVDYMNYYPASNIILHGHTDVHGSPINNYELSKKRVLAVRNTLVTLGIDPDRIRYIPHGDTQPLPGKEEGNKRNRRVEVELVCNGE